MLLRRAQNPHQCRAKSMYCSSNGSVQTKYSLVSGMERSDHSHDLHGQAILHQAIYIHILDFRLLCDSMLDLKSYMKEPASLGCRSFQSLFASTS